MKAAFSLVELSIVLVILGLLVGGILAGQSLIRAAELRAVTTEQDRHRTAIHTFRNKYFSLPGDMPNATRFWGDQASGTSACASAATDDGTPGTCNGNGDGNVGNLSANTGEALRGWQHLQMAGLIEGTYTGYLNSGAVTPGINAPKSKWGQAGWGHFWRGGAGGSVWGYNGNVLQIGLTDLNGLFNPVFVPADAWNIDGKLDDGIADRGWVLGANAGGGAVCHATGASYLDAPANRPYLLNSTATECYLYFKM